MASRILLLRFRAPNIYLLSRYCSAPKDISFDKGSSFYVIPEIPPNKLQSTKVLESISPFSYVIFLLIFCYRTGVTHEDAYKIISRRLMDCQLGLSKFSQTLGEKDSSNLSVIDKLTMVLQPLSKDLEELRAIGSFSTDPMWTIIISRLFQKLERIKHEYLLSDPIIYQALLNEEACLRGSPNSENANQITRLLDECWLHGAALAQPTTAHQSRPLPKGKNVSEAMSQLRDTQSTLTNESHLFQSMVSACSSVSGPDLAHARSTGRLPKPNELVLITGADHIPVAESDLAPSTPSWLPSALGGRQNGGHIAGMRLNLASDDLVQNFLQHCCARQVRQSVWSSWVQRASYLRFASQRAFNDSRIQTIRRLRRKWAHSIGCSDWLEATWQSTRIGRGTKSSQALIADYLEPLRVALHPLGVIEFDLVQEWASSNLDFVGKKLDAWDIDYAVEQYNFAARYTNNKALVRCTGSNHDSRQLIEAVNQRALDLFIQLADLFGFKVTKVVASDDSSMSSSSFQLIISDPKSSDDKPAGRMLVDLFEHPDRPHFMGNSVLIPLPDDASTPSVALLSDLPLHSYRPETVNFEDFVPLAHAFGQGLHQLLCRRDPIPSTTTTASSSDLYHLTGDICAGLVRSVGGSNFHSLQVPSDGQEASTSANNSSQYPSIPGGFRPPPRPLLALPLLKQLYKTRFDLSLWSSDQEEQSEHWEALARRHWTSHLPYAWRSDDRSPCSTLSLFGTSAQPGLEYCSIWRKIIAHDLLSELVGKEGVVSSPDAKNMLQGRFRDFFLSSNSFRNSQHDAAELFRRLRGRDPSIDFLLAAVSSSGHCQPNNRRSTTTSLKA